MDIVILIVFILVALIVLIDLLLTPWAKKEYKKDAYSILKRSDDTKEISQTIKGLNSTMGFIFKDEESKILIARLIDKLERSKD